MTHDPSLAFPHIVFDPNSEHFIIIATSSIQKDKEMCFNRFELFGQSLAIVNYFFVKVKPKFLNQERLIQIMKAVFVCVHCLMINITIKSELVISSDCCLRISQILTITLVVVEYSPI